MKNNFLLNKNFQRGFYFVCLLLWSLALLADTVRCASCKNAFGIDNAFLYYPVAALLLIQVFTNNRVLWGIFLFVYCLATVYFIKDKVDFYNAHKTEPDWEWTQLTISTLLIIPIILIGFILVRIKPTDGRAPKEWSDTI
jgi:hypothetical protein